MQTVKISELRPITPATLDGYIHGLMMKLWKDNTFQIEPGQRN